MICPKCEYEYVKGIEVCADCGMPLVPVEDFEKHLVGPSDFKIVYTTDAQYEAEMLKANLDGAGIETQILGQKDRNLPGAGDLSIIKVLVRKKDVESALAIIEDINSKDIDEEDETE